jgi:hypothetical protein
LGLGHGDAGFEAGHQIVIFIAASIDGIGGERERQKNIHVLDAGDGGHDFFVEEEIRAKDTYDGELVLIGASAAEAVQGDAFADDVWISIKEAFPEGVAEYDDGRLAGLIFFREKKAAVERFCAEEVEEAGGGLENVHLFRLIAGDEGACTSVGNGHLFEGAIGGLDVDVLAGGGPILRDVDAGGAEPEDGEAVGIGIGKGAQEESVDDAEDGGVCADSDGQRKHGDQGEEGGAEESPEGVANVG